MEARTRKKRMSAAYRYCFSGMVLQLWLYCEERLDGLEDLSDEDAAAGQEFIEIIGEFLEREHEERAFERLKELRNRIIGRVEILTAFSDCYQIYEYVLNRVERRFVDLEDSRYTPRKLAESLADILYVTGGPVQRNGWLRELLIQLPVRFTRKKFYAMITERLNHYVGLNKGSVEKYLYMLKSSVMLGMPEDMDKEEQLFLHLTSLRQTDYRNLDREDFEKCRRCLAEGSRILTAKTDYYMSLQQMINDLYVVFLTDGQKMVDAVEDMHFRKITQRILEALKREDREMFQKDGILMQMEGIQEGVTDLVMAGSPEGDEVLEQVDRLVSGSLFMPVKPEAVCEEKADRQWIDFEARKFCQELDGLFAGTQKCVGRAVMAKVISSLPIAFRDQQEVEDYICASLESCTDFAEREASMELLERELKEQQRLISHVLV